MPCSLAALFAVGWSLERCRWRWKVASTFWPLEMALNEGVAGSGFWHTCSCTVAKCWVLLVYVKWPLPIVQDVVQKRSKYQSCNCSVELWIAVLSYIYWAECFFLDQGNIKTQRYKDTTQTKSLFPESADFILIFLLILLNYLEFQRFTCSFKTLFEGGQVGNHNLKLVKVDHGAPGTILIATHPRYGGGNKKTEIEFWIHWSEIRWGEGFFGDQHRTYSKMI